MMSSKKEQAFKYVAHLLAGREGAGILPPLRRMAHDAGCSLYPMHQAVQMHMDNGSIIRSGRSLWNSSAVIPSKKRVRDDNEESRKKWQRVAAKIETDIYSGTFNQHCLPSIQQLSHSYGACFVTIKKALLHLINMGIIRESKRKFLIQTASTSPGSSIIVFITSGSDTAPDVVTTRNLNLLRCFEFSCSSRKIQFHIIPYKIIEGETRAYKQLFEKIRKLQSNHTILGFILAAALHPHLSQVVSNLSSSETPIAIVDEWGNVPPEIIKRKNVAIFPLGYADNAGNILGRYLVEKKYKKWCYFCCWPQYQWSINRYNGLTHVCKTAGPEYSVFQRNIPFDESISMVKQVQNWNNSLYEELKNNDYKKIREHILRNMQLKWCDLFLVEKVTELAADIVRQILKNQSPSVLIADNDLTAYALIECCRKAGVAVPGNVAVIGFDNLEASAVKGLTSFDFNLSAYAELMINTIIRPAYFSQPIERKLFSVDGIVVQRQTA